MMVIFLTGLVSLILMRTLRNDYAKYRREEDDVEALDRELSEVRRVSPAPCAPVCC
jgi:transmembrane 9 superfamily protein 3